MSTKTIRISSYKDFNTEVTDFERHIKMVTKPDRAVNVMVVSGDPGIGKSYRAKKILEDIKKKDGIDYVYQSTKLSPVEFYKLMWQHPNGIILLDDVNDLITDPKSGAALLKAATDDDRERCMFWRTRNPQCVHVSKNKGLKSNIEISNMMDEIVEDSSEHLQKAHDDGQTFPDMFFFYGSIIILTNKTIASIDKATEGALSNRGYHYDLKLTLEGALDLIKNFGSKVKNDDKTFPVSVTKPVISYMLTKEACDYYKMQAKKPTLRNVKKLCMEYIEYGKSALNLRTLSHLIESPDDND